MVHLAQSVVIMFCQIWSSWCGLPHFIFCAHGKEFAGKFIEYMHTHGVQIENISLEAPGQQSKLERRGGTWKNVFRKTAYVCDVRGVTDITIRASIVTQFVNSSINYDGYAPAQWVLGQNSLRAPGNLLDAHEAEMLEVQEAATDPQSYAGSSKDQHHQG